MDADRVDIYSPSGPALSSVLIYFLVSGALLFAALLPGAGRCGSANLIGLVEAIGF